MELMLHLDGRSDAGGSPLLMHNERLADPLDEWTRKLAAVTGKRKKTDADHMEIGRIEFNGGLYTNGNGPCLPGWNILRCLQDGATRSKRGRDVLRGVYPGAETADVIYEGPREVDALWKNGTFHLRKTVGVQRSRTMRTRPLFTEWQVALPITVDPTVFDLDSLRPIWRDAGVYAGIGDMRPVYGRFKGTIEEIAA